MMTPKFVNFVTSEGKNVFVNLNYIKEVEGSPDPKKKNTETRIVTTDDWLYFVQLPYKEVVSLLKRAEQKETKKPASMLIELTSADREVKCYNIQLISSFYNNGDYTVIKMAGDHNKTYVIDDCETILQMIESN